MSALTTATAPALQFAERVATVAVLDAQPEAPRRVTYQKSLFEPHVVQLPVGQARRRSSSAGGRRRGAAAAIHPDQQAFDFEASLAALDGQTSEREMEAGDFTARPQDGIYCDAPVAQPVHRMLAAALDSSMILMALAVFMITFYLCGGELVLNPTNAVLYAGIYAVLWFFYNGLFSICGSDTPGMIWTNLRLVTFDGKQPDRDQRISRMFGGVLGLMSAGLGMIWSLVDEEQLTWHDHISKTFPSPVAQRT